MRIALVILFFVGLHLALHPSSTVTVLESALQIAHTGKPSRVNDAAAVPAAAPVTAPHPAPVLPASASAALPAKTLSLLPDTAGPVSAVEPANVQHTAAQIAPTAVESHEDVARLVQKELSRLACFSGNFERKWGKKKFGRHCGALPTVQSRMMPGCQMRRFWNCCAAILTTIASSAVRLALPARSRPRARCRRAPGRRARRTRLTMRPTFLRG